MNLETFCDYVDALDISKTNIITDRKLSNMEIRAAIVEFSLNNACDVDETEQQDVAMETARQYSTGELPIEI